MNRNLLFQSTLPARGATQRRREQDGLCVYFNPRSLHGERPMSPASFLVDFLHFNPRSLHGERLNALIMPRRYTRHFNPRSLHGERRTKLQADVISAPISIHAPCTGSDREYLQHAPGQNCISIHAPCTGSDTSTRSGFTSTCPFQSTLPARGATRTSSDATADAL